MTIEQQLTVDEIARTSDDAAVRTRFDARNIVWLRVLMLLSLPTLFGATIALFVSHSGLRGTMGVANLFVAFVTWFATAPKRRWTVSRSIRRNATRFAIAWIAAQTFLFAIYGAKTEALIAVATILPVLIVGFRMRTAQLFLMHGIVAGITILAAIFIPPEKKGDTIPALIASGFINNGIAGAVNFALSRRMRRETIADFGERRTQAREQLRMRDELRYAREIQLSMLPERAPDLDWVDVAGISLPASEVGGDYYDYFVADDSLTIVAGDVAGHGLACGIVLAAMRAGFTLLRDALVDPAAVLTRLHSMIAQTSRRRMLVACAVLRLDRTERRATIAAAGHPPLLARRSDGSVDRFDLFASPLGVRLPLTIPSARTTLASGDIFVLHTDGAYEARNASGDSYGIERMEELLRTTTATTAAGVRDAIARDVAAFRGDEPQDDDLTIVVARIR